MKSFASASFLAVCLVASANAGDFHEGFAGPVVVKDRLKAVPLGPVKVAEEQFLLGAKFFHGHGPALAGPAFAGHAHGHGFGGLRPVAGPLAFRSGPVHFGTVGAGAVAGLPGVHAVAGPSYLISTVHHVQKVAHGGKYLGPVGPAVVGPVPFGKVVPFAGHLPAVKFPSKVTLKSLDGAEFPLHHDW